MDDPENVVSKVADTVAAPAKMGIKVKWTDRLLGVISAKRDYFTKLQRSTTKGPARRTSIGDG